LWVDKKTICILVKKAIAVLGTQKKLAYAMKNVSPNEKFTQSIISAWTMGKYFPSIDGLICLQIATRGEVKVGDFIPGLSFDTRMSVMDVEKLDEIIAETKRCVRCGALPKQKTEEHHCS